MSLEAYVYDGSSCRYFQDARAVDPLQLPEGCTVWLRAVGQDASVREYLEERLGLSALVIEDVLTEQQTPKIEDYQGFLYVVMHELFLPEEGLESLQTRDLDVLIGPNWVFTQHPQRLRSFDQLAEEIGRNPRTLARGPANLAHSVIDRLSDEYLPVIDQFEEQVTELESRVVEKPTPDLLQRIFRLKRVIQRLRRTSVYQREILMRLSRGDFDVVPTETRHAFRDVYDHFVRISDLTDSYRELLATTLEIYMSVTANRTNEVMRFLAVISTVMLPLTFIAGVYGMNFVHMPELQWHYGYPFAIGLMVAVAAGFFAFFHHKGWLGDPSAPAGPSRRRERRTPREH